MPSRKLLYVSHAVAPVFRRTAGDCYAERIPWADPIHLDDRSRVSSEWGKTAQCGRLDREHRIVLAIKE